MRILLRFLLRKVYTICEVDVLRCTIFYEKVHRHYPPSGRSIRSRPAVVLRHSQHFHLPTTNIFSTVNSLSILQYHSKLAHTATQQRLAVALIIYHCIYTIYKMMHNPTKVKASTKYIQTNKTNLVAK